MISLSICQKRVATDNDGSSRPFIRRLIPFFFGLTALTCALPANAQLGKVRMGIRLIRPDGKEQRDVVTVPDRYHHGSPCWSPDGKKIAFDAYRAGLQQPTLFIVGVDGKNLTELAPGAYPRWSPDGKTILYFTGLGKDPRIFRISADGTGQQELLPGAWPSWSADGKQILFSRADSGAGIWTADSDGTQARRLFLHQGLIVAPVWSPDSKSVSFSSNAGGNFDTYSLKADGTELKQLTTHPGMDLFPAWSPDGKRIAFTRYEGDNADVYVAATDGTGESNVTSRAGFDIDPAWSPNGDWIAYASHQ